MAEFTYDDFLNGSRNIGRDALFNYLRRIGVTVMMPNGSSHAKVVNAAGSTQILPKTNDDVGPGTLHGIHKFVDEHLAALAPQQKDFPQPRVIRVEDEAVIDAAGLEIYALSQHDHTVTLVDAHYPEIAVEVQLHDDLLITDSHIKAAAAERDTLVEIYQQQLGELKQTHRIKRVMGHGHPQLHITSPNSGRLLKGTMPFDVPTLDSGLGVGELSAAREEVMQRATARASELKDTTQKPHTSPQRSAPARAEHFRKMQYTLAMVGMELTVRQLGQGKVAYSVGLSNLFHPLPDYITAAEHGFIKNAGDEVLRSYRKQGMNVKVGLDEMRERISGAGNMQLYVVDAPVDDAPSEEALTELARKIDSYAAKQVLMSAKMARTSFYISPASFHDAPAYLLRPRIKNYVGADEVSLGVLSHTNFCVVRHAGDGTLNPKTVDNLDASRIMRYIGGSSAYEELMIEALGQIGQYPVLKTDGAKERHICITADIKEKKELAGFRIHIENPKEIGSYLQCLASAVGQRYDVWAHSRMEARGWVAGECTDGATVYTHTRYPQFQVSVPAFDAVDINYLDIKRRVSGALRMVEQADQQEKAEQAIRNINIKEVTQASDALKALGYCLQVNGNSRLLPPQGMPGLNGVTHRETSLLADKPHAYNSHLMQLSAELDKAQAELAKQHAQIARFKEVFGEKLQLGEVGMTIMVPNKKGDDIVREFAYAPTREGKPSAFFSPDTLRAVEVMISPSEQRARAERYALKASAAVSR